MCAYSNTKARIRGLLCDIVTYTSLAQQLFHFPLVKADEHVIADTDHRHTHLAGHLDHLLAFFGVLGNIDVVVLDIVFLEKLLRRLTEVAGGRAIDGYLAHAIRVLMVCPVV